MRQDLSGAIEHLNGNGAGDVLGYFVWWGTWEAMVAPDALRALFESEQLNVGAIPKPPTPALAFRRAVNAGIAGQKGITSKLISDNDAEITYGLREDDVDKAGRRAPARQIARVSWLPAANRFVSDNPSNEIVQRIVAAVPMYRDHYVSDDLRKAIKAVLDSQCAVPVAARGGNSSFAPAFAKTTVEALARVVRLVPNRAGATGSQTFVAAPVPVDESWKTVAEQAGRSAFGSKVEQAESDLSDFHQKIEAHLAAVADAESAGETLTATGPRVSSLVNRLGEFKELRDKIEAYSGALSFRADDMLAKLDAVRVGIDDLLGG